MDKLNQYLLDLAKKNAEVYSKIEGIKTILVVGSVGSERANRYSDIDTILIYDRNPDRDALNKAMETNGGINRKIYNDGDDGFAEEYYINGVQCQFAHGIDSWYDEIFKEVLENSSTDKVHHMILSGLYDSKVLFGEDYAKSIKERIKDYPRNLSIKVIQEHLRPGPVDEILGRIMKEDSKIWFRSVMVRMQTELFLCLTGINGIYIPRSPKKLDLYSERMKYKPENFYERINNLDNISYEDQVKDASDMWEYVLGIVEEHFPEVDTKQAREIFGLKLNPIEIK